MKNKLKNSKRGSGYLIVLGFASILLIFFAIFGRVRSAHHQLQAKDVRRFVASNLGEAALNCIVAELNANRAFNTHRYYSEKNKNKWASPVKNRETLIGKMDNITIKGVNSGIYSGYTEHGEFKAKFAQNYGSRENSKTKALRESEMYTRVEIVVKVGGGWGIKEQTYRKITAILERRYPATEYLLFDGEMLDIGGLGPFPQRENQLKRSRIYGYNWITFNTAGGSCKGTEIVEGEKIETPGLIRALVDTDLEFANKERHKLNKNNDSIHVSEFEDFDGYIVDGPHGAHPIKFTRLPQERIKNTLKQTKYKNSGIIIKDKTLPVSTYTNPYDSGTKYYDLDFGDFKAVAVPRDDDDNRTVRSGRASDDDDDDENNKPGDEEEEVDDIDTKDSDDPEIIKAKHGRKLLVYSEVPLRIWGCPDKSITIYSTKDIVIAGDFNQNPETSQVYKDKNYQEYKKVLRNGKNNNKVGAMIMSEGRIFIDMSSPSKFVKNEVKPYFFYCLGMSMHPSSLEIEEELKRAVCPPEPRDRDSIQGVNSNMGSGIAEARFGTMAYLYNYPEINSGGSYDANIEDLKNFFTPGGTALDPRFGIKDSKVRDDIIEYIKQAVRAGGDLTREEQDRIFEMAWKQSLIEEEKDFDPGCGASGLISGLFNEAVKKENDGLFIPEITINATLISSTRRASKWHIGNSNTKVNDEIGKPEDYLKKPGYIIQRIYGGDIRIGRAKPEYFVNGSHSGGGILRRRIWDNTNLTNRDFKPLEAPAVHNILTFTDEQISEKEYNNFKG